jgi:hypothetical protein
LRLDDDHPVRSSEKLGTRDVCVAVVYDSGSTPRHVDLRVHLPEGLTSGQLRRLRKVAETCPAKRALEAGFTFDEELVVAGGEMSPA